MLKTLRYGHSDVYLRSYFIIGLQPVSFRKIEEMESFGVAKADITKLKAGGYHTIEAVCAPRYLMSVCLIFNI